MDYAALVSQVGLGHALLAACAVFYLVWWVIFFRDVDTKPEGGLRIAGIASIVAAGVLGVAAVGVIVVALYQLPRAIPPFLIVAIALAVFLVLMVLTKLFIKRAVTTELALIVCWMALEVSVVNGITSLHAITGASFILLALLCGVTFIVSIICYAIYYVLRGKAAFIDGCIPLVLTGLIAVLFAVSFI